MIPAVAEANFAQCNSGPVFEVEIAAAKYAAAILVSPLILNIL